MLNMHEQKMLLFILNENLTNKINIWKQVANSNTHSDFDILNCNFNFQVTAEKF
jgi:hypothetical protein